MERNALQNLIEWNQNKRKKPLIVWGARQVGKTYLIKDIFAETYYKDNYIYIDCKKDDEIRNFIMKYGEVVVKPAGGALGIGVYKLNSSNVDGINSLLENVRNHKHLIIEQVIVEHKRMSCLNPSSVNTIRVVTMIDHL